MTQTVLVDRWFAKLPWPRGLSVALVGLTFIALPIVSAWSAQIDPWTLLTHFRAQFVYAAMIVYILLIIPPISQTRAEVAAGLRPLIHLDDAAYRRLVDNAGNLRVVGEVSAFCLGVVCGWVINVLFEPLGATPHLLDIYAYLSRLLIFGVNGWALFVLFSVPRVTNTLVARVGAVDIFDIRPFAPIGRQSLLLAAALIGGTILALLSSALGNRILWREYIIVYSIMLISTCGVFLVNTVPTHNVLSAAKRQHLDFVDRCVADLYYTLKERLSAQQDIHAVSMEINALATVRTQLLLTRTWPYNTQALRALTVTVLSPLIVGLARVVFPLLMGN
ncbi:MAG: hypothetical protein H6644_20865 [Caldilineaceae bacterium]|nr:hypothetical protein [Caldilineaceae bacterium]